MWVFAATNAVLALCMGSGSQEGMGSTAKAILSFLWAVPSVA